MNKDVEIPEWIGKKQAPEDKETTLELVKTFADLMEEPMPKFPKFIADLDDGAFLIEVGDFVNPMYTRVMKSDLKFPLPVGVWVGFPETPVGRANACLAGVVWQLKRALEESDG